MMLFARPPRPELSAGRTDRVDRRSLSPICFPVVRVRRRPSAARASRDRCSSRPIPCNSAWRCGRSARTRSKPCRAAASTSIEIAGLHQSNADAHPNAEAYSHPRRRAGDQARGTPPHLRPVLFRPPSGPRPGLGSFESLADRHQPRRPDRVSSQPGHGATFTLVLPNCKTSLSSFAVPPSDGNSAKKTG